ncbi:MAG: uncharacterized protein JWR62_2062 [Modestobacter sp.]|nr:uncharacterized protein [Modestobacter sp.]
MRCSSCTRPWRPPLTLAEALHWQLPQPGALGALGRNRCLMTIGSRLREPDGHPDTRTPARWHGNGTAATAGNAGRPHGRLVLGGRPHTWLGFASATGRTALPGPQPRSASPTSADSGTSLRTPAAARA